MADNDEHSGLQRHGSNYGHKSFMKFARVVSPFSNMSTKFGKDPLYIQVFYLNFKNFFILKINVGVLFPLTAGLVFLLINNLIIIYDNITN